MFLIILLVWKYLLNCQDFSFSCYGVAEIRSVEATEQLDVKASCATLWYIENQP